MNGYIPQKVDIIEPYILIDTASWDSVFSVIVASIINRYGDAIRVDINTFNDYDDDVIDQLFKWAGEIGDNLNMKVVYHSSIYDSDHDKLTRSYNLSRIARNINLAKKIEYNNMVYIVDEDALEGFSIPNIPQYIEEYGWTDIIKNMQYSDLTYKDLWDNNFEIYAL